MNYKAITKEAVIPTRANGKAKILVEILNISLLTNQIHLRDWLIVEDENGNITYTEIYKDSYIKLYPDESFSAIFDATEIKLDSPTENYSRLKQIASEAVVIMNNIDPPYGLSKGSFEKYVDPIITHEK